MGISFNSEVSEFPLVEMICLNPLKNKLQKLLHSFLAAAETAGGAFDCGLFNPNISQIISRNRFSITPQPLQKHFSHIFLLNDIVF
ncbi:hypothetical protein Csa_016102 [Cucumis sativus]|nr:hypothetical protein Csa_016102 [Cucumis sativus]